MLALFLIVSLALQLSGPYFLRSFVDIVRGDAEGSATAQGVWFISVIVVSQLFYAVGTYLTEDVGWTATNALRSDLTLHCLGLDLGFHDDRSPGEMVERIDGDVADMANFFSQFVIQILANGLLLVGVVVVLFTEDWRVGLILLTYVLAALVLLIRFQGSAVPAMQASRQAVAEASGFWEEVLRAREDLVPNGARRFVDELHQRALGLLLERGRRASLFFRAFIGSIAAVFVLGTVVSFSIGAYLFSIGVITFGTIFMILSLTGLVSENLRRITDQLGDFQRAAASIGRVRELVETTSAMSDGHRQLVTTGPPAVCFDDVSFQYLADTVVLDGVSFDMEPGTVTAVVGRTGGGKSTIAKLLFRFYDPTSGSVRFDGSDLREFRLEEFRAEIGFVTQDVELLHGSLRDNLTMFDATIGDDKLETALAELGLEQWLASQPAGLETEIEGSDLSAGEAQLLALARVLVRDPSVVILDEASSRLDPITQRTIERAVDALLHGRTALLIAHRLETVARADKVVVIESGRVIESGTYGELSTRAGSELEQLLQLSLAGDS